MEREGSQNTVVIDCMDHNIGYACIVGKKIKEGKRVIQLLMRQKHTKVYWQSNGQ